MSYRKLIIDKETWEYTVGREGVKIRSPKGKCTWFPKYELLGISKEQHDTTCQEYEDDWIKQYPIGPGDVTKHINKELK